MPRGACCSSRTWVPGEVVEVDVGSVQVVRTIGGLDDVHGVLVVPERHRLDATVTARNEMATIDEDTGEVLHISATGTYPDGLAYDPVRGAVWTTNEHAGTESVIDADTRTSRGTVELVRKVGNVVYNPDIDRMVIAVQDRNELAEVDPTSLTVSRHLAARVRTARRSTPPGNVMFVGCEDNAATITVDLNQKAVTGNHEVGRTPDVLAYDESAHRLYVASESGWVSVFDYRDRDLTVLVSQQLAEGAHTVAVDPTTHRSFFPLPHGDGGPVLREYELVD